MQDVIKEWKKNLGLDFWDIRTEEISRDQVLIDLVVPEEERYFIGISIDREKHIGIIYHDRTLTKEDIIHELLHVALKHATEWDINILTNLLVKL